MPSKLEKAPVTEGGNNSRNVLRHTKNGLKLEFSGWARLDGAVFHSVFHSCGKLGGETEQT
jgi:hypothetical protein